MKEGSGPAELENKQAMADPNGKSVGQIAPPSCRHKSGGGTWACSDSGLSFPTNAQSTRSSQFRLPHLTALRTSTAFLNSFSQFLEGHASLANRHSRAILKAASQDLVQLQGNEQEREPFQALQQTGLRVSSDGFPMIKASQFLVEGRSTLVKRQIVVSSPPPKML